MYRHVRQTWSTGHHMHPNTIHLLIKNIIIYTYFTVGCRIVTNTGLQATNTEYKQKTLQCHNAVLHFMISYSCTIYILVMYKRSSKNTSSLIYLYFFNPALFCNINTEQNFKPFLILKH